MSSSRKANNPPGGAWLDKATAHDRIRTEIRARLKDTLVHCPSFTIDQLYGQQTITKLRDVLEYSGLTDSELDRIAKSLANEVLVPYRQKLRWAIDPVTVKLFRKGKMPVYYTPFIPATGYTSNSFVPTGRLLIPATTSPKRYNEAILLAAKKAQPVQEPVEPPTPDPDTPATLVSLPTHPAPEVNWQIVALSLASANATILAELSKLNATVTLALGDHT